MKYRLWDDAGFLIAEIRFHSRTSEAVATEYIIKMSESVQAASYSLVQEEA